MKDSVPALLVNPAPGGTSFRDKLMNHVNVNKNVSIDINCLDDDCADLNDDEDVVTSRGKKGPTIHFYDWAMNGLCKPWTNALTIKRLRAEAQAGSAFGLAIAADCALEVQTPAKGPLALAKGPALDML
ncbi:PREDICTED: LOC110765193 isoform X1 [Prunus dulcis]|uniref:PREDICTED: LOC110765193 isoform X1 n=1 Tax=Prunus dulcis TaxID=3755 RepID=A0A5E4GEM1_PRUDU|nr:PREDICTED: LOC110765193 isoform X1 [Prunus dulcis]